MERQKVAEAGASRSFSAITPVRGSQRSGDVWARVRREAGRLAALERAAWSDARDRCLQLEKIRRNAKRRLAALSNREPERFAGEREWAEAALREVQRCEPRDAAAYTILSFANLRERFLYLTGSAAERDALARRAIRRSGVFDEHGRFREILR